MKKLFIIGAGGFGRELLQWVKDINTVEPTWNIQGFIDDDLNALEGIECDYSVVGSLSECQPKDGEYYALAIANPKTKEKIVENMSKRNMKFASIIHPTAILTPYSHYGEGLIMFPCAKLSVNSTVGKHVTIMSSGVGHDVKVGDYCTLCGNVTVIRNVMIGDRTYIASNVALNADVHIGNDCYIGMGSMVTKDVPDNSKTFCNPARILPQ
ncbi:MAG TPA: acetyltransferase [Candidatus Eubacterium avistercoris]|uniref:Acetyltransferase n=1 Tax=Candidatus Eubacterium avistercoris TaxID=2838567 RepID=A0A9D2IGD3_9FIRM|nr:acetyltransferase [Candidatus Eubacterium avistercoris]